jgi:coenzyme F420-reducing hydrogenase delta subunit
MDRLNLDKNRLQLTWISAAEGERFASKIKDMQGIVANVSPEEIEKSKKMTERG